MDLFTKIKAMNSFTESEQTFIDFIFNHPYDVIQLNLQQLSKTSYVSISTIYRVMEKLEINGLNQLKLQISESLKNNENLKIDFESEKEYFKDTMPNEMDVNRVVTEYAKVLFETNGKPIKCNTHYYLGSGGEKIVFL